jgi:hypothetical protein
MGLKCLLGHDYSAPEIERERVEDGDEVVTTLREVQTCARCGETRIVSENTEVTTMARLTAEAETVGEGARRTETLSGSPSDDEPSTDDPSTGRSSTNEPTSTETAASSQMESTPADTPPASAAASETDEGVELIEETTENATTENTTATEEIVADSTAGKQEDPADDGAEILESEPAVSDENGSTTATEGAGQGDARERGAWPAVDTTADESTATDSDQRSWPTHGGEDEGYGASASSSSSEPNTETVAYVGGPATDDRAKSVQTDTDTGLERSREQRHAAAEETPLRGPTEYYCPACGMTTDAEGSSLRAGDVCPECRSGYVAERSQ